MRLHLFLGSEGWSGGDVAEALGASGHADVAVHATLGELPQVLAHAELPTILILPVSRPAEVHDLLALRDSLRRHDVLVWLAKGLQPRADALHELWPRVILSEEDGAGAVVEVAVRMVDRQRRSLLVSGAQGGR